MKANIELAISHVSLWAVPNKLHQNQLKQPIKLITKFYGPTKSKKYYTRIPCWCRCNVPSRLCWTSKAFTLFGWVRWGVEFSLFFICPAIFKHKQTPSESKLTIRPNPKKEWPVWKWASAAATTPLLRHFRILQSLSFSHHSAKK